MHEETVSHVLNIEQKALQAYEHAQYEAEKIVADAKKNAHTTQQQALDAARKQAAQIIEKGQQAAEAARANIIAHAGADAQNLETVSALHIEEAIDFVIDKVIARN